MEDISRQELLERHRAEKKLLQAKIQSIKHAVPKGDKKRKKEAQLEVDALEKELKLKHEAELKLCNGADDAEAAGQIADETAAFLDQLTLNVESIEDIAKCTNEQPEQKERKEQSRVSKAQKRREKKSQQEKERQERIANEDVSDLNSLRQCESDAFDRILAAKKLKIVEIPSDGDCMYKSLSHQLQLNGVDLSVQELRTKTSEYMSCNRADFVPFLIDEKSGDLLSDEEFDAYCNAVKNTKAWGGQVELQALVKVLKVPIEVVQANGPPIVLGDQTKSAKRLIISYHRHAYHLGEHYNSLVKSD